MERLQKVIADAGYASRRKAEELIKDGKVSVNGKVVKEMGIKVDGTDDIVVNGVHLEKTGNYEYYLLNKPRGVVSTASDEHGRKSVVDFINTDARIYPVGRLDYDTTGIILLTNDGKLTNILTHPSNNVEKKYIVKLNREFQIEDLRKLKNGVNVDGRICKPTRVKIKKNDKEKDTSLVEITIVEGRNHIIKKVFMNLGYLVDKLTRCQYAFLDLEGLKSGQYRSLTIKEVKKLYEYHN